MGLVMRQLDSMWNILRTQQTLAMRYTEWLISKRQNINRAQGKREAAENKTWRPARQVRFDSQTDKVSPLRKMTMMMNI